MVDANTAAPLPVIFFDGEREINIGNVVVYPSMEFKNFQSILSQKIGISPHQISVFLDCQKKSRSSMDTRRRIPITGKVSFSAILREKDCFFLAVLKRSRRERRRKSRLIHEGEGDGEEEEEDNFPPQNTAAPPAQKLHLLRRNQGTADQTFPGFVSPYYDQIISSGNLYVGSPLVNYNDRLQNLQIQREKYLRSTNLYSRMNETYEFSMNNNGMEKDLSACEDCLKAKISGKPAPFHLCLYDPITAGFRTKVGPIARPVRSSD